MLAHLPGMCEASSPMPRLSSVGNALGLGLAVVIVLVVL